jgi:hypothetical protein
MTATLNDLRAALDDAARSFDPPPEVTLRHVEQRVAAADRRRRVVLSGVLAAVVATGGGLVAVEQRGSDTKPLQPGQTRLIRDDPVHPVTYRGMVRVSVTEWRMSPNEPITIALPDAGDGVLFARATCTGTSIPIPMLAIRHDGVTAQLPCVGPGGPRDLTEPFRPPFDSVKLTRPKGSRGGTLSVEAAGRNAVGTARIALYVRAGEAVRPLELDSNPRSAWSGFPLHTAFGPTPASPDSPVTVRGTYEKDLLVTLVVRGAGTLRATANGRPLTFECYSDADHILAASDVSYWTAGCAHGDVEVVRATEYGAPAQVYDSLDVLLTRGLRAGDPVTITVIPSGFSGDDWRLDIFDWTEATGDYYTSGTWTRK